MGNLQPPSFPKSVALNLQVVALLGVEQCFHRGSISDIIHNQIFILWFITSKIAVMVGGHCNMRSCIKGSG